MPIFGLNNAMVSIVAYNYGARKPDRIRKAVLFSCLAAFLFMLCGFAVFQLMPEVLLSMFDPTAEFFGHWLQGPADYQLGVSDCRLFALSSAPCSRRWDRACMLPLSPLARQLLVLLPVAYLLSLSGRLELVWWSFPIAEMASITVTALLLSAFTARSCGPFWRNKGHKIHRQIFLLRLYCYFSRILHRFDETRRSVLYS